MAARIIIKSSSIAALTSLVLLSGCSSGSSSGLPNAPVVENQGVLALLRTPKTSTGGVIYTTQMYGHDLNVYKPVEGSQGISLKYIKTVSGMGLSSPSGSVSTTNGYSYIANGTAADVLVFKTKHDSPVGPKQTLEDYSQYPVNVGVTPDRNLVAVSNQGNLASISGNVSVYLKRSDTPAYVLTYTGLGSDVLEGEGVAIDHQGNCYWGFNDLSNTSIRGAVVEFAGCSGGGSLLFDEVPNIGGLAFDQSGDLFYVDQSSGVHLCTFKGKSQGCTLFTGIYNRDPLNLNFDYHDKNLWLVDTAGYVYAICTQQKGGKKNCSAGSIEYTLQTLGGASNEPFGIAPEPGD